MQIKKNRNIHTWQHNRIMLLAFLLLNSFVLQAQKYELPAIRYNKGKLEYSPDSLGNMVPDYSYCGYRLSEVPIPAVPVKVVVPPTNGDATAGIQKAIDYVSGLPIDENGFRGAVLLKEGIYRAEGRFTIAASGVVIRGSGKKTVLRASGLSRETLIRVDGVNNIKIDKTTSIADRYVPAGSKNINVDDVSAFMPEQRIFIQRKTNEAWIEKLGMKEFGGETGWLGWKPGERGETWERTIEKIEGNTISLDAPLTTAIDANFGGGAVSAFTWTGRISNIGIENLTLESEYDPENRKDENHCWFAVTMENVENAWVRQVTFRHFAGSAVALYETASKVTVEDCISLDPVSEIAGQRRNTFFTMGQQTLFLRCFAENGNHDFATGYAAAGPNAFVQCESARPNNFSGGIDSWSSGVLFDNVRIDGHALSFKNRGQDGQGAGWTAANSMFWQCSAARIECFAPPTAQNYAYGAWAQFAGNGLWYEANSHIGPRSLFFAQLAERLGKDQKEYMNEILPFGGESTSSPTIEQAAEYTALAQRPPVQLKDFIEQAEKRNPIPLKDIDAVQVSEIKSEKKITKPVAKPIKIKNGWLVYDNKVLTGGKMNVPWWRGDARPFEAAKASPAITRFVPGRAGNGYTDNLEEVVGFMERNGVVAIDHNYGLWYDRRRDDHERVRRYDAEVWAPFYEQPFARSGKGEAWDRLSRYDLAKFNPWYWGRLKTFADLAAQKGKLLIHQNYFQHNILEAGAHWADFPWRPANNINNTGFPEPAPYAGDKRIYLAEQFYDIDHPVRRELHRTYIRQCLDNFKGQANVIQSISAEYTGPLHFVEFWLDVIGEWEQETGHDALVALSVTKDVQDVILADPVRSKLIDIIDIRYWAYRPDGTAYAPPGGANLAPRQHARKVKPGKRSFESVYRANAEYRTQFPGKAVIYSEGNFTDFGWPVLMGGGSMAVINPEIDPGFLEAAAEMLPFRTDDDQVVGIRNKNSGMILFSQKKTTVPVDLTGFEGVFDVRFIDPSTGKLHQQNQKIKGGKKVDLILPSDDKTVIWIRKR